MRLKEIVQADQEILGHPVILTDRKRLNMQTVLGDYFDNSYVSDGMPNNISCCPKNSKLFAKKAYLLETKVE